MTPTTPTLSLTELAVFLGQPVKYDSFIEDDDNPCCFDWERCEGILTPLLLTRLEGEVELNGDSFYKVRNIRPVLRPISAMTEDEAKECFRLAFAFQQYTDSAINVTLNKGTFQIEDSSVMFEINETGKMCCIALTPMEAQGWGHYFDTPAVVSYLDSIGVDCRGYLLRQIAILKTT